MKKIAIISTLIITTAVVLISCDSKRQPGKIYMPDMTYSRAYETYALRDSTIFTLDAAEAGHKIYYNGQSVNGSMKRGELAPYTVPNDSNGLLNLSSLVKNPLAPLTTADSAEAARLYNINCGICHGAKAEANGPVAAKIGGVKSIIAASPGFSDGRIFHVMTYGQNNMGSYASQLSREQRWRIVQYIRTLEPKTAAATPVAAAPKADSAMVKK
ncbi:c-type cytochrome [Ferruginibacter sp.]|nr:cytochrome c [Ferruginibacter sp.]